MFIHSHFSSIYHIKHKINCIKNTFLPTTQVITNLTVFFRQILPNPSFYLYFGILYKFIPVLFNIHLKEIFFAVVMYVVVDKVFYPKLYNE